MLIFLIWKILAKTHRKIFLKIQFWHFHVFKFIVVARLYNQLFKGFIFIMVNRHDIFCLNSSIIRLFIHQQELFLVAKPFHLMNNNQ